MSQLHSSYYIIDDCQQEKKPVCCKPEVVKPKPEKKCSKVKIVDDCKQSGKYVEKYKADCVPRCDVIISPVDIGAQPPSTVNFNYVFPLACSEFGCAPNDVESKYPELWTGNVVVVTNLTNIVPQGGVPTVDEPVTYTIEILDSSNGGVVLATQSITLDGTEPSGELVLTQLLSNYDLRKYVVVRGYISSGTLPGAILGINDISVRIQKFVDPVPILIPVKPQKPICHCGHKQAPRCCPTIQ